MKRIIVLALVVLLLSICVDAGAYPSTTTSNPRYKPGTGSGGGGISGGTSLFYGFDGAITEDVIPFTSVLLGDITIAAHMSDGTTLNFYVDVNSSSQLLSLPVGGTLQPTYLGLHQLTSIGENINDNVIGSALFSWTEAGANPFSATFLLNLAGDGLFPIPYDTRLDITFPFQATYLDKMYPISIYKEVPPAPVPIPPSVLLLAPGLFGMIVARRKWMK